MNNQVLRPLQKFLSNPSLVALVFFSFSLGLIFYFMGGWLIPLIISIVIAYLLEGIISKLEKANIRRIFAVNLVFFSFFLLIIYGILWVVPTIIQQAKTLITNLPELINLAQEEALILAKRFPQILNEKDISDFFVNLGGIISENSKLLLSSKLYSSLVFLISLMIYFILVPLLIFFLLKDKKIILNWLGKFMPKNKQIIQDIWSEVDVQIGNYIRGKFSEILIIWVMCLVPFYYFNLQYALLLSFMVGLSVLIPYIGATIVTIPVLVVAYMQFGLTADFYWVAISYFIIQALDGNVIVPIIFSEAVNIHPVAIISAVLIFGGLWGFWGVFLAIPLATLVKAIIEAWQRYELTQESIN